VEAVVEIRRLIKSLWRCEKAQDIVEYSMLLAVLVLACASILIILAPNIKTIWSTGNAVLNNGAVVATS